MQFMSMDVMGILHSDSDIYVNRVYIMHPLKTEAASKVVQVYIDDIYTNFETSMKILSDNGTEFKNHLFTDVANQLGVECRVYSPSLSSPIQWKN